MISIRKRTFTYKYIILDIFYDCEYPSIIFKLDQIVEVEQGRQRNGYVWVYLHRSYIVMDPQTCGAWLEPFASQNFVLSRDTTCASKSLSQVSSMRVHHTYLYMVFHCHSK